VTAILLTMALAMSVFQYLQGGEVRWVTDSFRRIELTGRQLIGSAKSDRLGDKFKEYTARASNVISRLGDEAEQSAAGLTGESVARAFSSLRNGISGSVVGVTDGDTIKVLDASRDIHKVRLTGIDAPEKDQPFGRESAQHLSAMIAGRDVFVESTGKDKYGRTLGKVLVEGMDVNLEQIKAGYAWWDRYAAGEQPAADRKAYERVEEGARAEKIGLWSAPNPVNPYDWRKKKQ
jgi:endonuclease YncB( thermonuclease family)